MKTPPPTSKDDSNDVSCKYCGVSYLIHREVSMLKAKLASLEMELEECRDAAENGLRWKSDIALLRSQLDDQTALAASWKARHDTMGAGMRRFGATAKTSIGALRKELGVLKAAATPGHGEGAAVLLPDSVRVAIERLTVEAAEARSATAEARSEAAALREELTRERTTSMAFRADGDSATAAHETRAKEMETRMASVEAELKASTLVQTTLKAELNDSRDAHSAAQRALSIAQRSLQEATAKTKEAAKNAQKENGAVARLEAALAKATKDLAGAERQNAALRASAATAGDRLASVSEEHSLMRRNAAALEAQVKAAEAGLKDARSLLVDAQSDHVAELEQLAASHGKKFASTKRKCEQLEANAVQAARAMKQSDDNLKTVAKAVEALQKEKGILGKQIDLYRRKLSTALTEMEQAKRSAKDSTSTRIRAQQDEGSYKSQVESLRQRLAEALSTTAGAAPGLTQQVAELNRQLEAQHTEIGLLRDTVARECTERHELTAALERAKEQALGNHLDRSHLKSRDSPSAAARARLSGDSAKFRRLRKLKDGGGAGGAGGVGTHPWSPPQKLEKAVEAKT